MKSSASEVRFLLVPLTREFRAPRREHSSSERSERLRTPAQGSLGDRGGCWFATPGRDPGVSRDSPVRSRSITQLHVGTTARQPRTLPCSLRELRSPQAHLLSESSNWLGQRVLAPQMGVQVPLPILPTPFDRASSGRTRSTGRDRWGGDEIPNLVLQSSILCRGANASLIQLEEGWAFTPEVLGSSPRGCTSQQVLAGQAVAVLQLAHNQSFGAGSTPAPATHQRI